MKKIKKLKKSSRAVPAFLIGWTHGEPPPPGYLAAWFDQAYGGPLRIRFTSSTGHNHFEAAHTTWAVQVDLTPSTEITEQWLGRLQWEHGQLAQVFSQAKGHPDRCDEVLHMARMARGLTLLTEGTTYDVATGMYSNPSDWHDRGLHVFLSADHIRVEQQDGIQQSQMWFHTRGLTKFGLDEIETFQPLGLSGRGVSDMLHRVANDLIDLGKNLKVGENVLLGVEKRQVEVVRHRTDAIYGIPLAFREIRLG
ncbi:MAG: hypothetical protein V3T42_00340 [Nitrospirales bacterium]